MTEPVKNIEFSEVSFRYTNHEGVRTKNWTLKGRKNVFREEIRKALEVYEREGSLRKAIKALGYPSVPILAVWVRRQKSGEKVNQEGRPCYTNNVRRHKYCGAEEKMEVLKRCFEGESPEKLAAEYGVAFRTIYNWKEKYLSRDGGSRMHSAEKKSENETKKRSIRQSPPC